MSRHYEICKVKRTIVPDQPPLKNLQVNMIMVLRDGLDALAQGVLGQLAGKDHLDRSLERSLV